METIVNEAVDELANVFSVDATSKPAVDTFKKEIASCRKRVQETTDLANKVQSETNNINELLQSLKSKDQELQTAFDKIDQLEVSHVRALLLGTMYSHHAIVIDQPSQRHVQRSGREFRPS
ncbi:hypothetical protein V8B55DRAFT_1519829 [Mucor lusitanicus]